MTLGLDAHQYWREQERDFWQSIRQIEHEEAEVSRPDSPPWMWLVENFDSASLDIERMFASFLDLPLAQALYVVKVLRETNRPLLERMAQDPRAALCVGRINQAVNRRWMLRAFAGKELAFFHERAS